MTFSLTSWSIELAMLRTSNRIIDRKNSIDADPTYGFKLIFHQPLVRDQVGAHRCPLLGLYPLQDVFQAFRRIRLIYLMGHTVWTGEETPVMGLAGQD